MARRNGSVILFAALFFLGVASPAVAQPDIQTVDHPYLGITLVKRTMTPPAFVRTVKMNIVAIDLTAPGIGFKLTPPGGTLETVTQRTLSFLTQEGAQFAVNCHFFLPVGPSNVSLIGIAASNGNVYSGFEAPVQSYAIVTNSPGVNIDSGNVAGIVHADTNFPDGKHVLEPVTLWNTVSGSAQIITNGQKTVPVYKDGTHPDGLLIPGGANYSNSNSWYNVLNPRTAIGLSQDNRTLFLFTVDGRGAGGSLGMTGDEMADLLRTQYGVYNALNLDGGGSTTLAMKDPVTGIGRIINVSSDSASGRFVGSNLAVFAALDTVPPLTTATLSPSPNANGWNNTDVAVTLTAADSAGGWVKQIQYSLAGAQTRDPQVIAGNTASQMVTAEGTTNVAYFATDYAGNQETPKNQPVRVDKTPPAISGMPGPKCSLWPPNLNVVRVATISAADVLSGIAPGSLEVTGTSSEPLGPGDIVLTPDGSGGMIVELRADRLGTGTGRIYTLTATVKDLAGNATQSTATCTVPHDQGKN